MLFIDRKEPGTVPGEANRIVPLKSWRKTSRNAGKQRAKEEQTRNRENRGR